MNIDNKDKIFEAKRVLEKHGVAFSTIRETTNRLSVSIGKYTVKVAVNENGMNENIKEFNNSDGLQPFVIKCYEVSETGLLALYERFIPVCL